MSIKLFKANGYEQKALQYCSDKQKLETRFLKETGFLAPQLFLTEQYWKALDAILYKIVFDG
ncbi:MAG: hypothetical protein KME30_29245 [Iphinoe sp. HA4291-MV1]|nr:hypothetical protein [Iphinoe sp. HA4291-MV1]